MRSFIKLCSATIITVFASLSAHAVDYSFYGISSVPATYNEGGAVKGYYAEILQRVGEELGLGAVNVNIAPYPRIFRALNENPSGVAITILFPNANFNENVSQPVKTGYFETGIISMASKPFSWDAYQGKSVATVQGASAVYGAKFHDLVESKEINLVSVTDYGQATQMLTAGRIDGFAGNLGPLLKRAKEQGLDMATPAVITEKVSMITVSVAPGTPDKDAIVAKVGAVVESMIASGEIQDIIEKYLPDAVQPR